MCLAIPGRVKKIEGRKAWVEYDLNSLKFKVKNSKLKDKDVEEKSVSSDVREAMVGEEGLEMGDWVMVQMGIISRKLSEKEAKEMLSGWSDK